MERLKKRKKGGTQRSGRGRGGEERVREKRREGRGRGRNRGIESKCRRTE